MREKERESIYFFSRRATHKLSDASIHSTQGLAFLFSSFFFGSDTMLRSQRACVISKNRSMPASMAKGRGLSGTRPHHPTLSASSASFRSTTATTLALPLANAFPPLTSTKRTRTAVAAAAAAAAVAHRDGKRPFNDEVHVRRRAARADQHLVGRPVPGGALGQCGEVKGGACGVAPAAGAACCTRSRQTRPRRACQLRLTLTAPLPGRTARPARRAGSSGRRRSARAGGRG